jgi:putative membrane protein
LASGGQQLDDGSQELAAGLERGAEAIPKYDKQESRRLADVIASPVSAQTERFGDSPDGPSQLAPVAIVVALWLGAFATYLLRPALPPWLLARPRSAGAVAFAGLRPGLAIGAAQVVLLYGALLLLGVDLRSPVAAFLLMLGTMTSFVAINQALVAALGRRRGWIVSIGFAGLQIVSLGGVIPVDTAPAPLRFLSSVLPMPQAAEGLTATVLEGPGSLAAAVLTLLIWGLAAVAVTTVRAGRAQQLDVRALSEDAVSRR